MGVHLGFRSFKRSLDQAVQGILFIYKMLHFRDKSLKDRFHKLEPIPQAFINKHKIEYINILKSLKLEM
jgi:hypothetical protein